MRVASGHAKKPSHTKATSHAEGFYANMTEQQHKKLKASYHVPSSIEITDTSAGSRLIRTDAVAHKQKSFHLQGGLYPQKGAPTHMKNASYHNGQFQRSSQQSSQQKVLTHGRSQE